MSTHVGTTNTPVTTVASPFTPSTTWTGSAPSPGDLVIIALGGKYAASATAPSAPTGWTPIENATGGVVTTGNDAGDSFIWTYGRVWQSGDSLPSFTLSPLPNSLWSIVAAYRPGSGKVWTDRAALGSIPWVATNDTTAATPLGSTGTFSTQPAAASGATLVGFGAIPTDLGTTAGTPVLTNGGLSGGTTTFRVYVESSAGADSAGMLWDRLGFTGTASGVTTVQITPTGATNNYGPTLGLWLREETPTPTTTSTARISLAGGSTPATRTFHSIKVRARVTNAAHSGTIRAQLYEGATARSAELESTTLTSSLATYALPLTNTEAASITDYSNLEIRFRGYSTVGDAATFEVAELWLDAPSGGGATPISGSESFALSEGTTVLSAALPTSESFALSEGTTVLSAALPTSESFALAEGTTNISQAASDSGALTEGASAVNQGRDVSESHTQSEGATTLSAALPTSDSATTSESPTGLSAALPANDSGALSESSSVSIPGTNVSGSDADAFSEGTTDLLAVLTARTDTNTLTEGTTDLTAALPASESHTQSEGTTGLSAALPASDSFTSSESTTGLSAALPVSESHTQSEGTTDLSAALPVSESHTQSEGTTVVSQGRDASDSGALSETSSATASVAASDSSTLGESSTLGNVTTKAASETFSFDETGTDLDMADAAADGTLGEQSSVAASLSAVESFSFSEQAAVGTATNVSASESITLGESAVITISIAASDASALTDAFNALNAQLTRIDSGAMTEASAMSLGVAANDSATQSEGTSQTSSGVTASDSFALGEASSAFTLNFKTASDSFTLTELAGLGGAPPICLPTSVEIVPWTAEVAVTPSSILDVTFPAHNTDAAVTPHESSAEIIC